MDQTDPSLARPPAAPAHDPDLILAPLESLGIRLQIGRVERLLESFDSPQDSYATVLVAGTNGKGSTAALLASMVAAAGYRTGLFTSPHLEGVEERLRRDGLAISRGDLGELLQEIVQRAESVGLEPPTYFEALTVAACLWFARSGVDLAVFEVGMGGRLDATNCCSPQLALVSEIGFDHVKALGDTLTEIACEKAGIFRPGVTAICAASESEARNALESCARSIGAKYRHVSDWFDSPHVAVQGAVVQQVRVVSAMSDYKLDLGLPGQHQVRNLLLALAGAEHLSVSGWPDLDREAIERGVRTCSWPGRLERVELPGGKVLWLDVAHNPQGAETLSRFLAAQLPEYDLLLGILADKDARGILAALAPGATRIVLTRPASERALDPVVLSEALVERRAEVEPDPSAALVRSLEGRRPLLVCGSLYLVGSVRLTLREMFGIPPPPVNLTATAAADLARNQA